MSGPIDDAEALARGRYMMLNLVRFASLAAVLIGIAISQQAIDLPVPLGIVLAVLGLLGFFFLPNRIARRWRSDQE